VSIGFSLHIEYRLDLFDDLVERIAVIEAAVVKVVLTIEASRLRDPAQPPTNRPLINVERAALAIHVEKHFLHQFFASPLSLKTCRPISNTIPNIGRLSQPELCDLLLAP